MSVGETSVTEQEAGAEDVKETGGKGTERGGRERREYIMKMGMGCEEGPRTGKGGAEGREEGWVQVCGGDERERGGGGVGGKGGKGRDGGIGQRARFPGRCSGQGPSRRLWFCVESGGGL